MNNKERAREVAMWRKMIKKEMRKKRPDIQQVYLMESKIEELYAQKPTL